MKIFGMVRTFFSEDENSKKQNEIFEIGHSCFFKKMKESFLESKVRMFFFKTESLYDRKRTKLF